MASTTSYKSGPPDFSASTPSSGYRFGSSDGTFGPIMSNTGMMDPSALNPYASGELGNMYALQGAAQNTVNEAFDPSYMNPLANNFIQKQDTAITDQYAHMGLAGSSAQMGAIASANNQFDLGLYQNQIGNQLSALKASALLNNQGYNMITGIQGQYQDFQNENLNSYVNLQNGTAQANASSEAGAAQGGGAALGAGLMTLAMM